MAPEQRLNATALEDLWRLRVWQARVRYERASATYLKALELQQEEGAPESGVHHAVEEANLEQLAARREYIRALRILTVIIEEGKLRTEE